MGTVIRAAAVAAPPLGYTSETSVRLAAQAANECLSQAGVPPRGVGVLINVGVYREDNTAEPALAAMVQKDVGISLDYLAEPAAGFSFDLMNGACGVLNAVQVAQTLLNTGSTERVLITAADTHPAGRAADDPGYPYADLGAALLLERSGDGGFGRVRTYGARGPVGTAGLVDMARVGTEGRRRIAVERDDDWEERLLDLTVRSVVDHVRAEGTSLDRTLLICNRPTAGFPRLLAQRLTPAPAAVMAPEASDTTDGEPHTAAPLLGYLRALAEGVSDGCDRLLFVTAGAGLSVACAHYEFPAGPAGGTAAAALAGQVTA